MSATSSPRCCPICNSEVTMVARLFLLAACLLGSTDALVVGGRGLSTVRQAATPLAPFTIMKSQEDKEFEEVRRPRPSPPSHPPLHRHAHHRPTLLHTSHGSPTPHPEPSPSRTLPPSHSGRGKRRSRPASTPTRTSRRAARRRARSTSSEVRPPPPPLPPAHAPSCRRRPLSAARARWPAASLSPSPADRCAAL